MWLMPLSNLGLTTKPRYIHHSAFIKGRWPWNPVRLWPLICDFGFMMRLSFMWEEFQTSREIVIKLMPAFIQIESFKQGSHKENSWHPQSSISYFLSLNFWSVFIHPVTSVSLWACIHSLHAYRACLSLELPPPTTSTQNVPKVRYLRKDFHVFLSS